MIITTAAATLLLYVLKGQLCFKITLHNVENIVDLSQVSTAVYLIKILNDHFVVSTKLIR